MAEQSATKDIACHWCKEGHYREELPKVRPVTAPGVKFNLNGKVLDARVLICDHCGHMAFFRVKRA